MSDWRYPGLQQPEEEPDSPCDGCHECGLRCVAGIQMTRRECEAILDHLREADPVEARRILDQEKQVQWFEDIYREACLFYDITRRGCLIYPVRPLVCRLFGRVEWMPCPQGKPLSHYRRGLLIVEAYAHEPRATFGDWCAALGLFDPRQVLGQSATG